MKKSAITAMVLAVVSSMVAFGRQLSADEALRRIGLSVSLSGSEKLKTYRSQNLKLAHATSDKELYVFDMAGGGYVVASGDDQVEAVLAEVPVGSFNVNALSPAVKWWLDEYCRQITWLRDTNTNKAVTSKAFVPSDNIASLYARWQPIKPLVTATWDQGMPYNRYCPTVNGYSCVTGCVATAMAQIIRTIGYAEGGGYKSNSIGDKVVDFNYDGYDFGLDNMPDVASYGSATGEQIDAVAKLMLACGLSVNMNYTPIESGANSYNVSSALVNNFGYDKEYTIYYSREMSIAK